MTTAYEKHQMLEEANKRTYYVSAVSASGGEYRCYPPPGDYGGQRLYEYVPRPWVQSETGIKPQSEAERMIWWGPKQVSTVKVTSKRRKAKAEATA